MSKCDRLVAADVITTDVQLANWKEVKLQEITVKAAWRIQEGTHVHTD